MALRQLWTTGVDTFYFKRMQYMFSKQWCRICATTVAADLGHVIHASGLYYVTCGLGVQEGSQSLVGVSRAVILRVCAQQAQQLQAFKLARWAYTQLQSLRVPSAWQVCLHA